MQNELKQALFLSELGHADSALQSLDQLMEMNLDASDTNKALIMNYYFEIAWEANHCNASIKALDWIMAHPVGIDDPEAYADIHNLYGIANKCIGNLTDANAHFKKATELDPNTAFLWANLAGVQLLQKDYAGVLASLSHLEDSTKSTLPAAILYEAEALLRTREIESAAAILHEYKDLPALQDDKKMHRLTGEVHAAMGNKDQACNALKEAKSMQTIHFKNHPDNGDFKYTQLLTEMMELEDLIVEHCR